MTRRKSYQRGNVQLHNGQWTLRYREFSDRTRKWILKREVLGKFKNKKAALKAAEPIMIRVNERNNCKPSEVYSDLAFRQFIDTRWHAYEISAKHKRSTRDCRKVLLKNQILPYFGDKLMTEITPEDIADFLNEMGRTLKPNTLQSLYGMLNLMFEIARQYDFIPQNPVRPLVHKPEPEPIEKPTLTPEQIRTILTKLPADERLFHLLVAGTGIRKGEGMAMRWLNFNEAERELIITHTLYRLCLEEPKTKTSKGKLRLHPFLVKLLVAHREKSSFQQEDDFIFTRPDGRPLNYSSLLQHLYSAMDEIGIKREKSKYGFHIFRHTAGTLLFERLGDLKLVQTVLRHADSSMTGHYVHSEQPVAEYAEVLTELILGDAEANCDLFVTESIGWVS